MNFINQEEETPATPEGEVNEPVADVPEDEETEGEDDL